ncbi:sulfatase-like hydrolase/transferase [soil metagenome]
MNSSLRGHYLLPYLVVSCSMILLLFTLFSCKRVETLRPNAETLNTHNTSLLSGTGKPNVILILADDIGYEVPQVNGGTSYSTPNIDAMAAEGMRFTQCRSSPLCSPSRFTFMTGKYNFRNYFDWGVMNPNEKTLATLFKNSGYKTLAAGKWQFDGGDASIRSLGFDDYSVWNPYEIASSGSQGSNYKNPKVYQNGNYLPEADMLGKYSDDVFTDYVTNFIEANQNDNFFIYYATCLCHAPYSPTPDDPAFATWDPTLRLNDTTYFSSMARYMDKKVGEIINKLKELGLYENTIVMFSGDNGTPHHIFSIVDSSAVEGGKGSTTEGGIHVPLIVSWPNGIAQPGSVNNNLIDFPDILATCADAADANVSSFGTLDGISFYNQLLNQTYTPRPWSYNYYNPHTNSGNNTLREWVQDAVYKLYYTKNGTYKFYNVVADPNEENPIKKRSMTTAEKTIYNNFKTILASTGP